MNPNGQKEFQLSPDAEFKVSALADVLGVDAEELKRRAAEHLNAEPAEADDQLRAAALVRQMHLLQDLELDPRPRPEE